MKKAEVKVLREEEWQIKEELVLKEEKVYVPKNKQLRVEIIWLYNDVLAVEHKGKQKMTKLVTRNYWQLEVTKDVGKYVEGCNIYQRMKNRAERLIGNLKLSEALKKLQTYLIVDFITKLLLVAEKDTILVVCNRLSKMTHFVTTIGGILAKGLAQLFRDNVWKLHRLLESIMSDRRLQFVAEITKELNNILDIEKKLLTLFHSQTDEQTEYMNQKLEQYL